MYDKHLNILSIQTDFCTSEWVEDQKSGSNLCHFELNMVNKESSAGDTDLQLRYFFCCYTSSSNFPAAFLVLPLPVLNGYQAWKTR